MDRELCFKIADRELYLEKILVEYTGIPIFFLCKDEDAYFLAVCEDLDHLNYIIVENTHLDVYNLLNGNISMRDAILKQKKYWEVISGEEIEEDCVTEYAMSEFHCDALPEKDAPIEILTDDIKRYVQEFNRAFLGVDSFETFSGNLSVDIDLEMDYSIDIAEYRQLFGSVTESLTLEKGDFISLSYKADMTTIYYERDIAFCESNYFFAEAA